MDFFLFLGGFLGAAIFLVCLFALFEDGMIEGIFGMAVGALLFFGAINTSDTVNYLEDQAQKVSVMEQTVKEQKSALEEAAVLNGVLQKRAAKTASLQGQVSGLESVVARYKGDNASLKETNAMLEGKLSAATNNLQTCEIEQGSILLEKDIVEAKLEKVTKLVGGVL